VVSQRIYNDNSGWLGKGYSYQKHMPRVKIGIQHGTLIIKEKIRNIIEYIFGSKSHQL